MELILHKVEKDNESELVVFKVIEDCNLMSFIVFDSTYEDNEISNLHRHSYMFPNQKVKANDYVLLYTKDGENNNYSNRGGSTTWEYYWGLDVNVWNEDGDKVTIVKIAEIKSYPI